MALIKKQVFLRSRDENLQQFLTKGDKGYMSLDEQANLSDEDHAEINEQLKNLRGKKAKSEPKSPWDDESDAFTKKGSPKSRQSKTRIEHEGLRRQRNPDERKSTSNPTRSDRRLDEEKNRPDLEGTTVDLLSQSSSKRKERMVLDQGSDNRNTADDRTQKEYFKDDYTSNFWFGKATRNQEKLNRRAGLRATREKIDTDAMSSSQKQPSTKKQMPI